MSPAREEPAVPWATNADAGVSKHKGRPRNIDAIDAVKFADNLQPTEYKIFGTNEESRILFLDVNIIDSTGAEPYRGDVLIKGRFVVSMSRKRSPSQALTFGNRRKNSSSRHRSGCRAHSSRVWSASHTRPRANAHVGSRRCSHALHVERRRSRSTRRLGNRRTHPAHDEERSVFLGLRLYHVRPPHLIVVLVVHC